MNYKNIVELILNFLLGLLVVCVAAIIVCIVLYIILVTLTLIEWLLPTIGGILMPLLLLVTVVVGIMFVAYFCAIVGGALRN